MAACSFRFPTGHSDHLNRLNRHPRKGSFKFFIGHFRLHFALSFTPGHAGDEVKEIHDKGERVAINPKLAALAAKLDAAHAYARQAEAASTPPMILTQRKTCAEQPTAKFRSSNSSFGNPRDEP